MKLLIRTAWIICDDGWLPVPCTFELALWYCRHHLEQMKAYARAKDLLETNGNSKLGKGTSTNMKSKVIRFTNKVDSAVRVGEFPEVLNLESFQESFRKYWKFSKIASVAWH